MVVRKRENLLIFEAQLAADGSVDVLSERAVVDGGDSAADEGRERSRKQTGFAKGVPHGTDAEKNRRTAGVKQVGFQVVVPSLLLMLENIRDGGLSLVRINAGDSGHGSVDRVATTTKSIFEWAGALQLFLYPCFTIG